MPPPQLPLSMRARAHTCTYTGGEQNRMFLEQLMLLLEQLSFCDWIRRVPSTTHPMHVRAYAYVHTYTATGMAAWVCVRPALASAEH